jgi:hypothetical protein
MRFLSINDPQRGSVRPARSLTLACINLRWKAQIPRNFLVLGHPDALYIARGPTVSVQSSLGDHERSGYTSSSVKLRFGPRRSFQSSTHNSSTPTMDLPLVRIFGQRGSNQLITAMNALHTEARATFGHHLRHGSLLFRFRVARGDYNIMASWVRRIIGKNCPTTASLPRSEMTVSLILPFWMKKNRVPDVTLRKNNLILPVFRNRFSIAHFGEKCFWIECRFPTPFHKAFPSRDKPGPSQVTV